ncbi:phosphoenolpyruvate carboxylase [Psychrobacter saeujeotis]|uniref:phosphoenolpyruvate carboxylase n=1 Tax=Psychrobacter saeujeotis TaxID=3143436 RepID=UPI003B969923
MSFGANDLLWSSSEVHARKPLFYDEINNGIHYSNAVLFNAISKVYRNIKKAIMDICLMKLQV